MSNLYHLFKPCDWYEASHRKAFHQILKEEIPITTVIIGDVDGDQGYYQLEVNLTDEVWEKIQIGTIKIVKNFKHPLMFEMFDDGGNKIKNILYKYD